MISKMVTTDVNTVIPRPLHALVYIYIYSYVHGWKHEDTTHFSCSFGFKDQVNVGTRQPVRLSPLP